MPDPFRAAQAAGADLVVYRDSVTLCGHADAPLSALFGLGLIGVEFATIFTNALMPTLTSREDMGRVSGFGWGMGYVGGIVLLVILLVWIALPLALLVQRFRRSEGA